MSTDRLTEVLNYLAAMSREIGEFRRETKARLAALESRLDGVESRIAGLESRLDRVEVEVREMRGDIRLMNRKFDVFAKDMMELRAVQLDQEKRVETLERKAGITDTV